MPKVGKCSMTVWV